jgi:Tfp pilus assembly protein PilV
MLLATQTCSRVGRSGLLIFAPASRRKDLVTLPQRSAGMSGRRHSGGFALIEVLMASAILVIAFLGLFATVLQAGKLASAAEEEALVETGLEQRIDQLRLLSWNDLTSGSGITTNVWTARPEATTGLAVTQETLTISPSDVPGTQTLSAIWNGTSSPTSSVSAGTALSGANAVKAVATLSWTGQRSNRTQTRSLITVISRGGISKSDR